MMTYIFNTQAAAEAASNALFLALHPEGTTERLYGWTLTPDGKFELAGVPADESGQETI
jgi:hypothetical protein